MRRKLYCRLFIVACCLPMMACASISGYPHNPEDDTATLAALQVYFSPAFDQRYYQATEETARRQLRDQIILNRIRAYDIEFDKFAQSLAGDRNGLSITSDLAVLALNGIGATTGGAATKAALAAASAGVVGAQGSVNKDLFYDRTVPALITQIQANRTKVKISIIEGISRSDAVYPLPRAYLDLNALNNAGGLPSAISDITQQASINRDIQQNHLDNLRSVKFVSGSSSQTITRWIFGGSDKVNVANRSQLESWITKNVGDIPFQTFISASSLEAQRVSAIAALHIM